MEPHRLAPGEARRIAITAQRLTADRPLDVVGLVHELTVLQVDPIAAIAPSADLVVWSRLGDAYRPEHLTRALEVDRTLLELSAMIRPMSDLPLHRGMFPPWASTESRQRWLTANEGFARDIRALLERSGPLPSKEIPDTSAVSWSSSGWTTERHVTQMLELLAMRGDVAIAGRRGRERVWDVPQRVYPAGLEALDPEDARRGRDERRLGALGIARSKSARTPNEPNDVGDAGEPAVVDGVKGIWRVDPLVLAAVREHPFEGRTALLSPFDRLIHDRKRTLELFGFDYALEMYKPAAKRQWGYYALPILHGDRLVGKLDAAADRTAGVLVVHAIHEDEPFGPALRRAVDDEVEALGRWLGLGVDAGQ